MKSESELARKLTFAETITAALICRCSCSCCKAWFLWAAAIAASTVGDCELIASEPEISGPDDAPLLEVEALAIAVAGAVEVAPADEVVAATALVGGWVDAFDVATTALA